MTPETKGWLLIGGGGHAKQVRDAARRAGLGVPEGFVDTSGQTPAGLVQNGLMCLGGWDVLDRRAAEGTLRVALAFGANRERWELAERLTQLGARLMSVVDPTSAVADEAVIEPGAVVLARAVVGPGCVVGAASIVNAGAIMPHDCVLGAGAHLAPGAVLGGWAEIGACTMVGLGGVVRDRVKVGAGCFVGMGAVVVADVAAGQTVVGVPARPVAPEA